MQLLLEGDVLIVGDVGWVQWGDNMCDGVNICL